MFPCGAEGASLIQGESLRQKEARRTHLWRVPAKRPPTGQSRQLSRSKLSGYRTEVHRRWTWSYSIFDPVRNLFIGIPFQREMENFDGGGYGG